MTKWSGRSIRHACKVTFFAPKSVRYNTSINLDSTRNASSNSLYKNGEPLICESAANRGRLDDKYSRNSTVLFKYGVLTNKAKIFDIHLRCADPRSILATMFHGQNVVLARSKPCCRLTEFQSRPSS